MMANARQPESLRGDPVPPEKCSTDNRTYGLAKAESPWLTPSVALQHAFCCLACCCGCSFQISSRYRTTAYSGRFAGTAISSFANMAALATARVADVFAGSGDVLFSTIVGDALTLAERFARCKINLKPLNVMIGCKDHRPSARAAVANLHSNTGPDHRLLRSATPSHWFTAAGPPHWMRSVHDCQVDKEKLQRCHSFSDLFSSDWQDKRWWRMSVLIAAASRSEASAWRMSLTPWYWRLVSG